MAIVDYEMDALTDPPQNGGASATDGCYTPQLGQARNRIPAGARAILEHGRVIAYITRPLPEQQLNGDTREKQCPNPNCKQRLPIERCPDCKQYIPIGREFLSRPHCCPKAYLTNTQRHIDRCMNEMYRADAQRLRCQALLDNGAATMVIELQFTFPDGLMRQAFMTSTEYYQIVRRTVTKEDLERWGTPFAPLDKASFLTYPAQCKFTQRIYDECITAGLLTKPRTPTENDFPVKFAVREASRLE